VQRERWERLEQVFEQTLSLPESARPAFLDSQCADDPDLRKEVETLLDAHGGSGVLDRLPFIAKTGAAAPSLAEGALVGAWKIGNLIGRGGMGEVYAATRTDASFEQRAALKLLRYEAAGQVERFHAERRILARLEHPGIARLLDGGMTADGRPYTVMEYVEGIPLTRYCRQRGASLRERLALFMQACDAVAFAHRNLIIHRDLKPDNILVAADGVVKLLDFGIAKLIDAAAIADEADRTVAPFTPDYAAPEQLTGESVTTGTDVYSLGVLLYELLAGQKPLDTRGLPAGMAFRLVLDREAPSPSQAARTGADHAVSWRLVKGDLDAIVGKCLRKEPVHRYETVTGLKRDIERHLRNEPVLARSGARAYVIRRFVQRHWLPVSGVLLLIASMAAAALYANSARLDTEQALKRADAVRGFVIDLFRQNDPEAGNGRSMSARDLVDIGARRIEIGFDDDIDTRIELLGVSGNLYRALGEYPRGAELLKRRLDQAAQAYSEDDPRRIVAQVDMAVADISAQAYDKAQALLENALSHAGQGRGERLVLRIRILRAFARLESERGNTALSIDWIDKAIVLMREPGIKRAMLAEGLSDRGASVFRNGDIAGAEQPLRAALALLDDKSLDDLGTLLGVRENLGMVLTSLGRFDEAIPLLRANADSTRQLFGDRHPNLANALHQLASALRQSGDGAAAIPVFREALGLYEHNFGRDHNYVAVTLTGLAQSLSAEGNHEEAIAALLKAEDIYSRTLGPLHAHTVIATIALADARLSSGDSVGAEDGFRAALSAFARIGDGRHIYAEAARLGLGKALSAQHRCAEAEQPLTEARARFEGEFGANDRRSIETATVLIHCLVEQGKRDQARQLFEASERAVNDSRHDMARQRSRLESLRAELDG